VAYIKLPYTPKSRVVDGKVIVDRPSRGVEIGGRHTIDGKPAVIIESKAVNEQRRRDRAAAGLTNDFKLIKQPTSENAVGDLGSYAQFLEDAGLDAVTILNKDGFEL
jgi:hypothetical protein